MIQVLNIAVSVLLLRILYLVVDRGVYDTIDCIGLLIVIVTLVRILDSKSSQNI